MPTHSEPVLQQIAASGMLPLPINRSMIFDILLITFSLAFIEPYFFAFGGDIAYDNSFSGCYRRWDDVLMMLERNLVTVRFRVI